MLQGLEEIQVAAHSKLQCDCWNHESITNPGPSELMSTAVSYLEFCCLNYFAPINTFLHFCIQICWVEWRVAYASFCWGVGMYSCVFRRKVYWLIVILIRSGSNGNFNGGAVWFLFSGRFRWKLLFDWILITFRVIVALLLMCSCVVFFFLIASYLEIS